ncbi:acetyl-CoA C-acyltransferase [Zunongwangia sp.]|uniref:acetyl-CoA C-acyltransferase n=1 Tax=Zunongwangia sp. TaxID=1965325 RepID=UPI003AA9968F
MNNEVVIVSAARTPIGSFLGSLSNISAVDLGRIAIKGALEKIDLNANLVEEVIMGNVVQAGNGQAPARQAALKAGIPDTVPCTTVNKVCASGMKAVMQAAQSILLGHNNIVIAGGMENMSQIPHYVQMRKGQKFGPSTLEDGLQKDGLVDAYNGNAMGVSADLCAKHYNITREEQDEFALNSYKKAASAWENGKFKDEVVPVSVPQSRGEPLIIDEDEEFKNVHIDKISSLRPAFSKAGTVTAANASTINDGAGAVVLMSRKKAEELGVTILCTIKSFADAAQEPKWFTTSPAKALPKALELAGKSLADIDYFEFNEAFSVVGLVNLKLLGISSEKANVNGGAVSLGHPLGCSGVRILITLMSVLSQNNAKFGAAAICNGGGGASAMIIERV